MPPARPPPDDDDDLDHDDDLVEEEALDLGEDGSAGDRPTRKKKRERRGPRKVTSSYLGNVAKWYVERYQPSSGQLRRALMKRVRRGLAAHGGDAAEAAAWVEEVIARQIELGAIDDMTFARAWAQSYHRRGVATRDIQQRLRAKELPAPAIEAALQELRDHHTGDPGLAAACAYVRRRRFGPFRPDPAPRAEKDLAAVVRAGHPYGLAKRVLACPDLDAFLALEEEAGEAGAAPPPSDPDDEAPW